VGEREKSREGGRERGEQRERERGDIITGDMT
jgi:hypothetical protein